MSESRQSEGRELARRVNGTERTVRIKFDGPVTLAGKIEIDGKDISHMVRGFSVSSTVGEVCSIKLDLMGAVEIEGAGEVDVTSIADRSRHRRITETSENRA